MHPFGAEALPQLQQAHASADLDTTVEITLRQFTGMEDESVKALRADETVWGELRRLSYPLYAETNAINDASGSVMLATNIERVDLIVGERNHGRAPYGTSFEDVARRVPGAALHELSGQGHLAHLEAPAHLATFVNKLASSAAIARRV